MFLLVDFVIYNIFSTLPKFTTACGHGQSLLLSYKREKAYGGTKKVIVNIIKNKSLL